jgi:hypothetical protein
MPYFDYDGEIHIDVDDFLSAIDVRERKELIEALVEDGHIPKSVLGASGGSTNGASVCEFEFEQALDTLHGKYSRLTKEEEDIIIKISKRF